MARTVRDAKLDSRNARDRLAPRAKPYYKMLLPKVLHLGYRRRKKGRGAQGRWLVRLYLGLDAAGVGRYREKDLGLADDFLDADGAKILDYTQAQQLALEWKPDDDAGQPAPNGPLTVRDAIGRYLTALEHNGRPTADARLRAALHILPPLGSELVETLTTERLRRWLADIAERPPRLRQKRGATGPRFKVMPENDETRRRRRSTANRVLTILKASLNYSFDEGHVDSNHAWGRRLKPFRQVDAARTRFLTIAEAQRLANASESDFRNLVMAGLHTGARFGELGHDGLGPVGEPFKLFGEPIEQLAKRTTASARPLSVRILSVGVHNAPPARFLPSRSWPRVDAYQRDPPTAAHLRRPFVSRVSRHHHRCTDAF